MRKRLAIGWLVLLAGSVGAVRAQDDTPPPELTAPETPAEMLAAPADLFLTCETCGRPGHCWARADILWWSVEGASLPPLITTSPSGVGIPSDRAGVLGEEGTAIVFGDETVNNELRWGARFGLGAWLDPEHSIGIEMGFFFVESRATPASAGSDGSVILSRPFLSPAPRQQDAELVSFPGLLAGTVSAVATSGCLYGLNIDLRENLCCEPHFRLDLLTGYRFLRYDESMVIHENLTALGGEDVVPGTRFMIFDSFSTKNEFHGVDFGLAADWWRGGPVSVELLAKLAIGKLFQTVDIGGATRVSVPGDDVTAREGGLLALSSNIGHHKGDNLTVLPELGINIGWQVSERLHVRAGYTIFWIIDAVRAAEQADLVVNPGLIPPASDGDPPRPAVFFRESDIWVQGIALGAEYRY
jgi:hypothetical protein